MSDREFHSWNLWPQILCLLIPHPNEVSQPESSTKWWGPCERAIGKRKNIGTLRISLFCKNDFICPRWTCCILSSKFQLRDTENGNCFKVYTIIKVLEVKHTAIGRRPSLDSSDRKNLKSWKDYAWRVLSYVT